MTRPFALTPNGFIGCGLIALTLATLGSIASAATLSEAVTGDFSNDRLAPTVFTLNPPAGGLTHTFSGSVGRASGVVDRDYVHIVVPSGYLWTALNVGSVTVGGGGGAFLGLASGPTMPVPPTASDATGLLGYTLYGIDDRGTDILDDLSVPDSGSSGFTRPLPPGSYTVWFQELTTGNFPYSFDVQLAAVPEPTSAALMLLGVAGLVAARRARQR
jgi:PEP-CTERM motif